MVDCDVLIVGGGPAGCAVAARLCRVRPELRVLVLDRYRFPRDKPCGGALTGRIAYGMEELGLALRVPSVPCDSAAVRFGSCERVVAMGRPVQVIRRAEFDTDLVAQVRERGIEVVEGEGVTDLEVGAGEVVATTSGGRQITAKVVVGADGAASVVRKKLGGGRGRRRGAVREVPHRLFQHEMTVPAHVFGGHPPVMTYDFSLMTQGLRGYLWLFPVPGDLVNVGVMHYPSRSAKVAQKGGSALVQLLRQGLADHGVVLPERSARGWPVWGYDPRGKVADTRLLTVGDAAGIDGLTGEGISVAMEQAILAGDAIALAFERGDFRFTGYRRALRREVVGRELALDRHLARLLYGGKRWREWLSLLLFDPQVIEMYARRVDGTAVLADQKVELFRALGTHALAHRRRRRELLAAGSERRAPHVLKA